MKEKAEDIATLPEAAAGGAAPSEAQLKWLRRGLEQPGGKLPLFDREGQRVSSRTVESCIRHGWAEPWFNNPLKPDWLVCKLTDVGRAQLEATEATEAADRETAADANVVPLRP